MIAQINRIRLASVSVIAWLLPVMLPAVQACSASRPLAEPACATTAEPERLAQLIASRARVMREVAVIKHASGGSLYDAAREAEILARVTAGAGDPGRSATLTQLQMDLAKQIQAAWWARLKERTAAGAPDRSARDLVAIRRELDELSSAMRPLLESRASTDLSEAELGTTLRRALSAADLSVEPAILGTYAEMLAYSLCR